MSTLDRQTAWAMRLEHEARMRGEPAPVTPTPQGQAAVALLRRFAAQDQRVNACPHRGCRTGCGNAECRSGLGDQGGGTIASIVHCRACEHGGGRVATAG